MHGTFSQNIFQSLQTLVCFRHLQVADRFLAVIETDNMNVHAFSCRGNGCSLEYAVRALAARCVGWAKSEPAASTELQQSWRQVQAQHRAGSGDGAVRASVTRQSAPFIAMPPQSAASLASQAGHNPGRRPVQFWKDFNAWWRQTLERLQRRPLAAEINQWYEEHAAEVWPEDIRPTAQETRVHAKCLRSVSAVKEYFRRYRAQKKVNVGDPDDGDQQEEGATATATAAATAGSEVEPTKEEGSGNQESVSTQSRPRLRRSRSNQAASSRELELHEVQPPGQPARPGDGAAATLLPVKRQLSFSPASTENGAEHEALLQHSVHTGAASPQPDAAGASAAASFMPAPAPVASMQSAPPQQLPTAASGAAAQPTLHDDKVLEPTLPPSVELQPAHPEGLNQQQEQRPVHASSSLQPQTLFSWHGYLGSSLMPGANHRAAGATAGGDSALASYHSAPPAAANAGMPASNVAAPAPAAPMPGVPSSTFLQADQVLVQQQQPAPAPAQMEAAIIQQHNNSIYHSHQAQQQQQQQPVAVYTVDQQLLQSAGALQQQQQQQEEADWRSVFDQVTPKAARHCHAGCSHQEVMYGGGTGGTLPTLSQGTTQLVAPAMPTAAAQASEVAPITGTELPILPLIKTEPRPPGGDSSRPPLAQGPVMLGASTSAPPGHPGHPLLQAPYATPQAPPATTQLDTPLTARTALACFLNSPISGPPAAVHLDDPALEAELRAMLSDLAGGGHTPPRKSLEWHSSFPLNSPALALKALLPGNTPDTEHRLLPSQSAPLPHTHATGASNGVLGEAARAAGPQTVKGQLALQPSDRMPATYGSAPLPSDVQGAASQQQHGQEGTRYGAVAGPGLSRFAPAQPHLPIHHHHHSQQQPCLQHTASQQPQQQQHYHPQPLHSSNANPVTVSVHDSMPAASGNAYLLQGHNTFPPPSTAPSQALLTAVQPWAGGPVVLASSTLPAPPGLEATRQGVPEGARDQGGEGAEGGARKRPRVLTHPAPDMAAPAQPAIAPVAPLSAMHELLNVARGGGYGQVQYPEPPPPLSHPHLPPAPPPPPPPHPASAPVAAASLPPSGPSGTGASTAPGGYLGTGVGPPASNCLPSFEVQPQHQPQHQLLHPPPSQQPVQPHPPQAHQELHVQQQQAVHIQYPQLPAEQQLQLQQLQAQQQELQKQQQKLQMQQQQIVQQHQQQVLQQHHQQQQLQIQQQQQHAQQVHNTQQQQLQAAQYHPPPPQQHKLQLPLSTVSPFSQQSAVFEYDRGQGPVPRASAVARHPPGDAPTSPALPPATAHPAPSGWGAHAPQAVVLGFQQEGMPAMQQLGPETQPYTMHSSIPQGMHPTAPAARSFLPEYAGSMLEPITH